MPNHAAEDRATSFQAVEGAVREDVPGGPLLVGAYAFVWLAVFLYVWRLGRMQARAFASMDTLERALAKLAGSGAGAGADPESKSG
jgi:CcmD family protein